MANGHLFPGVSRGSADVWGTERETAAQPHKPRLPAPPAPSRQSPDVLRPHHHFRRTPRSTENSGIIRKAQGLGRATLLPRRDVADSQDEATLNRKLSSQAQLVKLEERQPWDLGSKANICRRHVSEETAVDHPPVPLSTADADLYPEPTKCPSVLGYRSRGINKILHPSFS